nr:MAG TPA: hypothetical protein [Crassvirales sp.]
MSKNGKNHFEKYRSYRYYRNNRYYRTIRQYRAKLINNMINQCNA